MAGKASKRAASSRSPAARAASSAPVQAQVKAGRAAHVVPEVLLLGLGLALAALLLGESGVGLAGWAAKAVALPSQLLGLLPAVLETPLRAFLVGWRGVVALVVVFGWLYARLRFGGCDYAMGYVVTHYRWIFACALMPVSFIFDGFWMIYVRYTFMMGSAPHKHMERVGEVQRQIREWNEAGRPAKLCTARAGWLAMSLRVGKYKKTHCNIKINLRDVLDVDATKGTVRVEPLVNMGQLSAVLEPLGWTLPVTPELDDLTVGGLICGVGVESSSHKYGLFQETCVRFELVMANGELVTCSRTENAELFYAVPWSHGTLGFLVCAEIQIIPAKQYVRLEYRPCYTHGEVLATFSAASLDDTNDFVEGLAYSRDTAVVMTGKMCTTEEMEERTEGTVNRIGLWFKPWWFKHVEEYLTNGSPGDVHVQFIPLRDWYHRHTRAIFWELQDIIPFGNNVVFRWLFGWAVPPKIALIKVTQTEELRQLYEKYHVVQDMLVPLKDLGASIDMMHEQYNTYPLWLCPMKVFHHGDYFVKPSGGGTEPEMYVDVGAYGNPKNWPKPFTGIPSPYIECSRRVEEFVREVGGFQMLYADTYMDREEFKGMFDHGMYDKMRARYGCDGAFPRVYDKVCKAARN